MHLSTFLCANDKAWSNVIKVQLASNINNLHNNIYNYAFNMGQIIAAASGIGIQVSNTRY